MAAGSWQTGSWQPTTAKSRPSHPLDNPGLELGNVMASLEPYLHEHNLARTHPSAYAAHLEALLANHKAGGSLGGFRGESGKTAIETILEAIDYRRE